MAGPGEVQRYVDAADKRLRIIGGGETQGDEGAMSDYECLWLR